MSDLAIPVGQRIRQARLIAGLTLSEAAKRLSSRQRQSVSQQKLSDYEKGNCVPSASLLLSLAQELRVGVSYFFHQPGVAVDLMGYRCQSRLTKTQKSRIEALAQDEAERQIYLYGALYPDGPPINFPDREKVSSYAEAEETAENLRRCWRLGCDPIESMTHTVENNGGIVVRCSGRIPRFEGLSGYANQSFPVVVVSGGVTDDRSRFSIAHEIGHLTMDTSA
ncbi:MAG: ImmA/IrrE family metallo-endopeptidase [Candidatus Coatesbacteria bacterium]|nr:ImmA/IrrE family metallo-endopeptidase [Candidatus Coatesbacteria bacterium]